jgi:hypothetical protein
LQSSTRQNGSLGSHPPADGDYLAWNCQRCGALIADGDGYITVSYRRLHEYDEAVVAWEQEHPDAFVTFGEFMTRPSRVRWQVLHARCDPAPDGDGYTIDVERIRTPHEVISCSAQLLEKNWIQHTNWDEVLRKIGGLLP